MYGICGGVLPNLCLVWMDFSISGTGSLMKLLVIDGELIKHACCVQGKGHQGPGALSTWCQNWSILGILLVRAQAHVQHSAGLCIVQDWPYFGDKCETERKNSRRLILLNYRKNDEKSALR